VSPGRYETRSTIPQGLRVERGVLIGHLKRGSQDVLLESSRPISIETSSGPTVGTSLDLQPPPNGHVNLTRPPIRVTFPEPVRANTLRLYLDQIDISRQANLSQDGRLLTYVPNFDLQLGQHRLEVEAQSTSAQRFTSQWNFEVSQAARAFQILTLEPADGESLTIFRPRISATFDRPPQSWRLVIDGSDFTRASSLQGNQVLWQAPYDLSPGQHRVEMGATDRQGQNLQRSWNFLIGQANSGPVSALTFSAPSANTGNPLQVAFTGPPGGKASFSLASARNAPMSEASPGRYVGTYQVRAGDRGSYPAQATLRLKTGQVLTAKSDSQVSLNHWATPLTLDLAEGSAVPAGFLLTGSASPGANLRVNLSYIKPDIVSTIKGRRVQWTLNGQAGQDGRFQISLDLSSVPTRLPVTLVLQDLLSGASMQRTVRRQ